MDFEELTSTIPQTEEDWQRYSQSCGRTMMFMQRTANPMFHTLNPQKRGIKENPSMPKTNRDLGSAGSS